MKSWGEGVASRKPRTMNATTWKTTRPRMICAIRRSEKIEPRTTITSRITAQIASPGEQVTSPHCAALAWRLAQPVRVELLNAEPRLASPKGTYEAAKFAFAD